MTTSKTPRELGYRMPAEWEPHASTWLTWPRPQGISFPDKYDTVPPVYAALIRHRMTAWIQTDTPKSGASAIRNVDHPARETRT